MTIAQWSMDNKHTLRDLYGDFLLDTGVTEQQLINGECVTYSQFIEHMYSETIYAKN